MDWNGRSFVLTEKGFTLIEILVAITCSTILFLALFSSFTSILTWMGRLNHALGRDNNVDLVPLILAPLVTHAGSNRQAFPQPPVELQDCELTVRSDTSGSGSFPDGSLDDPLELLSFRQGGDQLQMKSRQCGYQPLLNHVAVVTWLLEGETILNLDIETRSSGPGSGPLSRRRLQFALFLPNLQPTLLPADAARSLST